MKVRCPDCRKVLVLDGSDELRCESHKGQYRVLFVRPQPPEPVVEPAAAGEAPPSPPARARPRCERHPNVESIARCDQCGSYCCATCAFAFPGDTHLCPRCATEPQKALSPKRRNLVIGGYVAAAVTTLGIAVLLSGVLAPLRHDKEMMQLVGVLVSLFVFAPGLVGMALSFSAFEKRLPNPPLLWGAVIWNAILMAVLALLILLGLMR